MTLSDTIKTITNIQDKKREESRGWWVGERRLKMDIDGEYGSAGMPVEIDGIKYLITRHDMWLNSDNELRSRFELSL